MVTLTRVDGVRFEILASEVIRIRRSGATESPTARTHLEIPDLFLALEEPAEAAALVKAELPSLVQFTTADSIPVWIDALKAVGPYWITEHEKQNIFKSAIRLAGKKMYVVQSHQEVAQILASGGGKVLPIPPDALFSSFSNMMSAVKAAVAPEPVWD